MRDNTAPRVIAPLRREIKSVSFRLVWGRESARDRLRRRLRLIASDERFRETIVVVTTFMVVGVLLICLYHVIRAPHPATAYALGILPH